MFHSEDRNFKIMSLPVTSLIASLKVDGFLNLTLLTIAVLIIAQATKAIYYSFTSPLANIPGPLLNHLSNWPLRLATIRGNRIFFVDALHAQYGPCVLLSPDEVSISDLASAKEIHRIEGNFLKAPWYSKFSQEEFEEADTGIFSMREPKVHAERRKLFANALSKNAITECETVIKQKVGMAIAGIRLDVQSKGAANILNWFTYMANDVIAALSFGKSFQCLEQGEKTQFIKDLESVMMLSGMSVELPWLQPIFKILQPNPRLAAVARTAIAETRKVEKAGRGQGMTIFAKMVAAGDAETLNHAQIEREAIHGADSSKSSVQLGEEFTAQDAAGLPFLSSVIQETLMLYGAAPGALPRTVPSGGRMLGGQLLPEGATVSTQAYTLHRKPSVFIDPHKIWPQRWESPSQEMKDAYMPYGGGTRICIGMHLATLELALGAATFFKQLPTARLAEGTNENTMQFETYFLIAPKSHACLVTV